MPEKAGKAVHVLSAAATSGVPAILRLDLCSIPEISSSKATSFLRATGKPLLSHPFLTSQPPQGVGEK